MRPVLGRPPGLAGADRPGVEQLAVVGDSHLVRSQVDDGYVAVTDDERRREGAFPPGSATGIPTVEAAVDLHLVSYGPVRGRPEVKLDGAEPVPATGDRLAHGDREVGLDGLLSGQCVDGLGEHEDDRLANSYSDPRRREHARGHDSGGRCRREGPRTLRAERSSSDRPRTAVRPGASAGAQHRVVDSVSVPRKKLAGRVPLVASRGQNALQLAASRQDRHPYAVEPSTVGANGDHRAQGLFGRTVRRRHGYL